MADQGNRNMLWPKVVGQSGTARADPVLVTSPPKTTSTSVANHVTSASRCLRLIIPTTRRTRRRSVTAGAGARPRGRLPLRQEVFAGLRRAVLVGPAVHRGDG